MTKQQAVAPNPRIVANRDVFGRVSEGHLHDLTVLADREPRVWKLKAANVDVFVKLRIITNLKMGRV